jgi:hypothetical protein
MNRTRTSVYSRASQAILLVPAVASFVLAQATQLKSEYPIPPRTMPEAEEIVLALSAAPAEISSKADVYVLRATGFAKVRRGTNGCACMVSRDLHAGSRYPICFDGEAAKTSMPREIREVSLRAKGMSEAAVKTNVEAALASGELPKPTRPAVSYMMSPKQVLFSSPFANGVRIGAWSPHLMLTMPGITRRQLGVAADSKVDAFSLSDESTDPAELVVKVTTWSDGTPVLRHKSR